MNTPDTIHHTDLFELCEAQDDASVDMILADLPYGVTACEWDVRIPIEPMWEAFQRIIKPRGAIVLTATEPFASMLRMSWLKGYKYEIIMHKTRVSGFLNANRRPLKAHENILIFSKRLGVYNPQMREGEAHRVNSSHNGRRNENYGHFIALGARQSKTFYPTSVITVSPDAEQSLTYAQRPNKIQTHPTQKPVALFEYLIRTYTQPGEIVFDPVVGSGTTAVASRNTGRRYIVGDMMEEYVDIARTRVQNTDPYQPTIIDDKHTQLSLFGESS